MNESLKAEDIIRQYGLKLTQPRLKVLRLLLSRQEVLTADEIYEALVKEGTSLNFSTVYRTLETFTDEKITEKVQEARMCSPLPEAEERATPGKPGLIPCRAITRPGPAEKAQAGAAAVILPAGT